MNLTVSWPILNVLAVLVLSAGALVDSRSRTIATWLFLPALFGGAVALLHLTKVL